MLYYILGTDLAMVHDDMVNNMAHGMAHGMAHVMGIAILY